MRNFAELYYRSVKEKITVSTGFLFFIAAAIMFVPVQWLGAWALSLIIHELCHIAALYVCGGNVTGIHIGCSGVIMKAQPLPPEKEAFCAFAGPLGALILLLVAAYMPRTAICTFVFSAYNLLPIFPLDGGRGLLCILKKYLSEDVAERAQRYIENAVLVGILLVLLYSVIKLGLGVLPAVLLLLLFLRRKKIKFPCKKCHLGLQ